MFRGVRDAGYGGEETKRHRESHFGVTLQWTAGKYIPELSQQEAKKQGYDTPAPADNFRCGLPQEMDNSQALLVFSECACTQAKGRWEPQGGGKKVVVLDVGRWREGFGLV